MYTSHSTLNAYFPLVQSLRDYLNRILREDIDPNKDLQLADPSPQYEELLDACVVGVQQIPQQWPAYGFSPPFMNMREVRLCFTLSHHRLIVGSGIGSRSTSSILQVG
jgi:hypothetical protein